MNSSFKKILWKCRFVIILLILLLIFYYNPTKEIMTCDKNYKCTVEHEFVNFIKYKNTFELNPASMIYIKTKVFGYRNGQYKTKIVEFDNITPFIDDYYEKNFDENEISNDFYEYRDNPEKTYYLKGFANSIEPYFFVVVFLILCIPFKDFLFDKKDV